MPSRPAPLQRLAAAAVAVTLGAMLSMTPTAHADNDARQLLLAAIANTKGSSSRHSSTTPRNQ